MPNHTCSICGDTENLFRCDECGLFYCDECWRLNDDDTCKGHTCEYDWCEEKRPHTHETCHTCEGEKVRMVKCCYPTPLSRIECCCGYSGGFVEEECPSCDGVGVEDTFELGYWP